MVRRYFHRYMKDKHYNRKWGSKMGGYIGLESDKSEFIRGQVTPQHIIQESIDSLNKAIERLGRIISEMDEKCKH